MTIDDVLNTLAKKFTYFDDTEEMGNYYIKECKKVLLEIIKGVKPKKEGCPIGKIAGVTIESEQFSCGFNQGVEAYEKAIEGLLK